MGNGVAEQFVREFGGESDGAAGLDFRLPLEVAPIAIARRSRSSRSAIAIARRSRSSRSPRAFARVATAPTGRPNPDQQPVSSWHGTFYRA